MIEIVSSEKDKRKIRYGITEKGKQELETWLSEETMQQPIRSEFMLKLLFSSSQPRENVIRMLENYKELHKKNIEKYLKMQKDLEQGIQKYQRNGSVLSRRFLEEGIISGEAVIRWCDETIEELRY